MKAFLMKIIVGFFFITFISSPFVWAAGTAGITVTVTLEQAGNQPPVLDPIGDKTVDEGIRLNFRITATDPDEDILTFTIINQPPGSEFRQTGDHGRLRWQPTYDQAGTYEVTFIVTDDGEPPLSDSEAITITVNDVR